MAWASRLRRIASRLRFLHVLAVAGMLATAAAEAAPRAEGSSIAVHAKLPVARPDFPVPSDPDTIFYIQRSTNSNTVVYVLNYKADGKLDPRQPVKAFWRRFNTSGERKELGFLEARMAYGVSARKTGKPGEYAVSFVALPNRKVVVQQQPDGTVTVTLGMGGHVAKPAYAYVQVDEASLVSKVERVQLYGVDEQTAQAVVETINVGGGEIEK